MSTALFFDDWLLIVNYRWLFFLDYYSDGFLTLQHGLHQSIVKVLNPNGTDVSSFSTLMQRFPYPPYTDDIFLTTIQSNLPFFIMLCMIFFSLNIPKEVTLEKERKLKVVSLEFVTEMDNIV